MSNSLWGDIPLDETILTPKAILETQATELTTQTHGLLEGIVDVESGNRRDRVVARLLIKVPALNNYTYEICAFMYPLVEFYPCVVLDPDQGQYVAEDEARLVDTLRTILQSDRVRRAIRGLLSQARS